MHAVEYVIDRRLFLPSHHLIRLKTNPLEVLGQSCWIIRTISALPFQYHQGSVVYNR